MSRNKKRFKKLVKQGLPAADAVQETGPNLLGYLKLLIEWDMEKQAQLNSGKGN